jgi:alkylhydroperoxidase family enzyme
MTFISTVAAHEATGYLKQGYDYWQDKLGQVPNVVRAVSLRPESLRVSDDFRNSVTFGASNLGRRREELIATLISDLVQCHY